MRILFLSAWYPYPPDNGSKLRIYNLLRGLAQRHEVTLLTFADQPNKNLDVSRLRSLCREVHIIPCKVFNPHSLLARLGFLSPTPRWLVDTFSPEMKQFIEQALSTEDYELVIASEINMTIYSQYFNHLPALLDELQVGVPYQRFTQEKSLWRRVRYGLTWIKLRRYLTSVLKNFRVCIVASDLERQLLSQTVTNYRSVEVIPNCINLADYNNVHKVSQTNSLIFTGSFNFGPNYEAMIWFLREVFPRIQSQVPNVCLTITGDHANLPLPPSENVTLTGYVDDVRPLVAAAEVSLAPILVGGGTRLKILEAMALRTPVVATMKGAEGLGARDGQHLLLADTPEIFAEAVIRLLEDPELRQQLTYQAYQLVQEKYDWASIMPRFLDLAETIARV